MSVLREIRQCKKTVIEWDAAAALGGGYEAYFNCVWRRDDEEGMFVVVVL